MQGQFLLLAEFRLKSWHDYRRPPPVLLPLAGPLVSTAAMPVRHRESARRDPALRLPVVTDVGYIPQ